MTLFLDSEGRWERRRWQLALLLGTLLLGGGWLWRHLEARRGWRPAGTASVLTGAAGPGREVSMGGGPSIPPELAAVGATELAAGLLTPRPSGPSGPSKKDRLRQAEERLAAYRHWARYPADSRPASEHPERLEPTAPLHRTLPLARQGGQSADVRLQLGQDRVTLVGSESARLSLRCEDSLGTLLPCTVLTARALPLLPGPASAAPARAEAPPLAPAELRFSDDGRSGDEVAGDGVLTATLQPARLGFGGYLGPLRVALALHAQTPAGDEGETGEALFDLWYTPEPPAVLTGQVREAIVDGSLHLYLGIDVRTAGHYELAARVDDSRGKSFALLTFESDLTVGQQEVTLVVFGKLIRDAAPAMPLRLRDVDGFLLRQPEGKGEGEAEPDREHLPLLAGYVHTSGSYPPAVFSSREWQSEERDRTEKLLRDEVDAARGALSQP